MGPRKALPLVAAGLVAALLSSGCGVAEPAAATVDGTDIDRGDFEDELKAIRENPVLLRQARGSGSEAASAAALIGTGRQTINSRISTRWLTNAVYAELVLGELKRRKVEVTADHIEAARAQLVTDFGEEVARAFPAWFRDRVAARNARIIALQGALSGNDVSDAGLLKYYEANKTDFDEICVAHILLDSKAAGDAALARLRGGESFAALAKELSGDNGTKDQGGDLGCTARGRLVKEFEDAAFNATIGQPTAPVETSFGWHLILVGKKTPRPFADVKEEVANRVNQAGREKFEAFVVKAVASADVSIDPRYGTFEAPDDDSGQTPTVVAPRAPQVASKRPGPATTTTTSGEQVEIPE